MIYEYWIETAVQINIRRILIYLLFKDEKMEVANLFDLYTLAGTLIMIGLAIILYFVLQTPFAGKYEIYVIVTWCIGILVTVAWLINIWRNQGFVLQVYYPDLIVMFLACYYPVKFAINHSGRWSRHKAGTDPDSDVDEAPLSGKDLVKIVDNVGGAVGSGVKLFTTVQALVDAFTSWNGRDISSKAK